MIRRKATLAQLSPHYLFPQVQRRVLEYLKGHPEVELLSLSVGDTTEPLPPSITEALAHASQAMGTAQGYAGYGPEQGIAPLRIKIAERLYAGAIAPEEIFISDGAKCDLGRLQLLFGDNLSIALQDPSYPVYAEGSLLQGAQRLYSLHGTPENGFFPDLESLPDVDLLYFCSPNNPTGIAYTYAELERLVAFAKRRRCLLIFDAAYAGYIRDSNLPTSIYAIPGAHDVAIEVNSFSKLAGFTGIRLGWTVVPEALKYADGSSIRSDWNRITCTLFNGASILAQRGGLAVLEEEGWRAAEEMRARYLENARLLRALFQGKGRAIFGGEHAPYLWVPFPGKGSWEAFQQLLEAGVVTTPGCGFGAAGEGYLRLSAYGSRDTLLKACDRLEKVLR